MPSIVNADLRGRQCGRSFVVAAVLAFTALATGLALNLPLPAAVWQSTPPAHYQRELLSPAMGPAGELLLPLDLGERRVVLRLRPHSSRAADFVMLRVRADGTRDTLETPAPASFRGEIVGDPGSRVAATVRDGQVRAALRTGAGAVWLVQPARFLEPGADAAQHAVYAMDELETSPGTCGADEDPRTPVPPSGAAKGAPGKLLAGSCTRDAQIAFDVLPLYRGARHGARHRRRGPAALGHHDREPGLLRDAGMRECYERICINVRAMCYQPTRRTCAV